MEKNYVYAIVLIVLLGIVVLGVYWAFFLQPDDAFDALPSGVLDDLLANVTALTEVLTYHVVSGEYMAADVVTLSTLTTVQGDDLAIDVTDTTVKIDGATVVQTDIETSNGVIHVIDMVVVPGGILDIVQTAQYAGSFTTLVTALEAADLDDAFDALPSGVLDDLLANVTALTEVLTYHVVSGEYMAADVVTLSTLTTLQGGNLTISATDGVQIDGANVVQTDITCRNGVIHVIDAVLIP